MPLFGAVNTPVSLSSGEAIALLNAEDLANNGLTMAVEFTPQPSGGAIPVAVVNQIAQAMTLQHSLDGGNTWEPAYSEYNQAIVIPASSSQRANLAPCGFYRIANKSGSNVNAGTIYIGR